MAQAGVYTPGPVIDADVTIRVNGVVREHVSVDWAGDTTGGLPEQVVSVDPEPFNVVERPFLAVEDMHQYVRIIEHDPPGLVIAFLPLGADLELHGAVLDDRNRRGFKFELEGRLVDDRHHHAVAFGRVVGALVVDFNVMDDVAPVVVTDTSFETTVSPKPVFAVIVAR